MRDFLDDYIPTLSTRRQERVQDILASARISKENLDPIIAKLMNMKEKAPIVLAPEQFNGLIDSAKFDGAYRDIYQRMLELYETSNIISLLLDTHTGVLTSEIKAIEDEISAMTKVVDNYAFTLADNGFFDYSFTETFNDDTMRLDWPASRFTDRSGVNFADEEAAYVNSASGVLTLTPALEQAYLLIGAITNSNCSSFITSDTGLENALNQSVNNGWRVAVSAPRPIASTITGGTRQGAQIEIELSLAQPSPCDNFIVTPFSDRPFEILKLEVYSSNAENDEEKLILINNTVKRIDKVTEFSFGLRTVTRVKLTINQPVYTRGALPTAPSEKIHRTIYNEIKARANIEEVETSPGRYRRNQKALNETFISIMQRTIGTNRTRIFRAQIPQLDFDPNRGPMSIKNLIRNERLNYDKGQTWMAKSKINSTLRKMIHEKLLVNQLDTMTDRTVTGNVPFFGGGTLASNAQNLQYNSTSDKIDTHIDLETYTAMQLENTQFLNYEYDLGFRNVQIGRGVRYFRGVYVTKSIPANSDSGEVKIRTEDVNYIVAGTDRDSSALTSIEYSITNKSDPKEESDWISILPTNETQGVIGERLFFDEAGYAKFRFLASKENAISIYRNGYSVDLDGTSFVESGDSYSFKGLKLPYKNIGATDMFTADYIPYGDPTIINFIKSGFESANLASAFDEQGAGQTFSGTSNSRLVTLNYEPYVDYTKIANTGGYSTTLGFTGSYQPITIILEDGTVALNQTNYNGITQNNLTDFGSTQTAYIHSGNKIIFNRVLTEKFTVYYQYLPSNLKLRIILRVNDPLYVSPQVDFVNVKTKTRKANPRTEF